MNLHNQIMNIPVPHDFDYADFPNKVYAYKSGHRDARHAAAELSLKAEARIEELEALVKYNEDTAWHNFNITQEVFNYLLTRGAVSDDLSEEDTWEAAAQNIIKAIEDLENK